jgi:hypothetical protein
MDEYYPPLTGELHALSPADEATKQFFSLLDANDQSRFIEMCVAHFSEHFGPMVDNAIGRNEVKKAARSFLNKISGYSG